MTSGLIAETAQACEEVAAVFRTMDDRSVDAMLTEIRSARRIAVYGVGREGLMMKAFAMRLFHLGLDAHVVGDMTTPPVGAGDLLIVSAGPGDFSTVKALIGVAKEAGARTLCVTAQPGGACPVMADSVVHLPAQTMANDLAANDLGADDLGATNSGAGERGGDRTLSILPMGSLYEGAQYIFFEIVVLRLRDVMGLSPAAMRANHTNLE